MRTGSVEFESKDHELTASGRIEPDGSFSLGTYALGDGAVAGNHRVIVVQFIVNDGTINHTMDHGTPVPARYAAYETSGLSVTVAERENDCTLTLSKAAH